MIKTRWSEYYCDGKLYRKTKTVRILNIYTIKFKRNYAIEKDRGNIEYKKKWRQHLRMWEQKYRFLFIHYYIYSIWSNGRVNKKFSIFAL